MMKQYFDIKNQNQDKIILFRLGDFYEMFYEDAEIASKILQITLTRRGEAPMCGIPHHQINNYLYKLIRAGKKAAIVEQDEIPSPDTTLVKRSISQIVTPGTITDPNNLDQKDNNFLLSIHFKENMMGSVADGSLFSLRISCVDLSTGDIELKKISSYNLKIDISNQLANYNPREILIPDGIMANHVLENIINEAENYLINSLPDYIYQPTYCESKLKNHYQLHSLKGLGLENDGIGMGSLYALIHYGKETQKNNVNYFHLPKIITHQNTMFLDAATIKNLELVRNNLDHSIKNTLLGTIDNTITAMGGRLLKRNILQPLLDPEEIENRLSQTEYFYSH